MTTRTVRALFLDGIELALWETAQECAEQMEFDSQKLRRSWMSEAGNVDDLEDVRTKLSDKIDGARGATPAPKIPPIRQLYVEGLRQELWTTRTECAESVDLSTDTLRKYLDRNTAEDCAGSREITQFTELQTALRKKLRQQKKLEAQEQKTVAESTPSARTPTGDSGWEDSFLSDIAAKVAARLREVKGAVSVSTGASQPSTWIDEVFAGQRELVGQSTPDCRFVIARASDIVPLVSGFTKGERKDTAALVQILIIGIRELRRRLTLSAQTADQTVRTEDLRVLGAELDTLVVSIEQASDSNLGASAVLRQAQRNELSSLRNTLAGGEKQ